MSFDPRKLIRRLHYWLHRDEYERDLREEMEEHRRLRGDASVTSTAFHMEAARAVWIPPRLESIRQDLRYGARQLGHNRLFTVVSIAGLAFAIGLNTAVFSVMEAVFLRPLPVKDGDRVVRIVRLGRDDRTSVLFSESELRHYRESGSLEDATGFATDDRLIAEWPQATAPRAMAAFVMPDFFAMLGGQVLQGRLLRADDTETTALITESAWKRRLGGRPDVVGGKLLLNGFPFTIAGVVADKSIAIVDRSVDVVLPFRSTALLQFADAKDRMLLLGKVAPGIGIEQAQAALGVAAQQWFAAHPEEKSKVYRPLPLPARVGSMRGANGTSGEAVLLLFSVLLVLLIACANLTNLLLARAAARRSEMGVRLALGASRMRLVRQLLTECFILTTAAGILGLVCAQAALSAAQLLLPRYVPVELVVPWLDFGVNWNIFLFTLSLCALTAVLFGLVPALEATRTDVAEAVKHGAARGSLRGARWRALLIAGQMAACVILLVMTASVNRAMTVMDDFLTALNAGAVIQAELHLVAYGYSPSSAAEFIQRVRQRLEALPEVAAVGLTRSPFIRGMGHNSQAELEIEGRGGQRSPGPGLTGFASDGILPVFGQRLISGRDFTAAESRQGAPVVLINEPMARDLWPHSTPLGSRIRFWRKGTPEEWLEVAGVVAEKPIAEGGARGHSVVRPIGPSPSAFLQIRARGERGAAMLATRRLISGMDARLSFNVNSLQTLIDFARMIPLLVAAAAFAIAILSLAIAAIGLYGVTAYIAARRTREIGIRMALGARPGDVLRLIVRQGSIVVATGLALGSVFAAGAERVISAMMVLLPASPLVTYVAILAFLGVVALAAMVAPSVAAARVNPVTALRHDR